MLKDPSTGISLIVLAVIVLRCHSEMRSTQCTGEIFSLYCGSDSYIIHVLYEQYSYGPDDKCRGDQDTCTQSEILNPISAAQCNGYSRCNFLVSSGITLSVCGNQNATSYTVVYNCVAANQIVDVCSSYKEHNFQKLYLKSPNYPKDKLSPTKCQCNITGQNITAEIFDHQKSNDSTVVFYFVLNHMAVHVNDVQIRNRILFSGTSDHVKLILDNRYTEQMFKLWMEIRGQNMNINCEGHPIVKSNQQTDLFSSFQTDQWAAMISSYQPNQSETVISTRNTSDQSLYFLSKPIKMTEAIISSIIENQSKDFIVNYTMPMSEFASSFSSSLTINPDQTHPVGAKNQTDHSIYSMSSTIGLDMNKTVVHQNDELDTDIRVIVVTVCVFAIVITVSLSLGIFIYRKNHRQLMEGFQTEENDRDYYHAYNFSFENK